LFLTKKQISFLYTKKKKENVFVQEKTLINLKEEKEEAPCSIYKKKKRGRRRTNIKRRKKERTEE